MTSHIALQINEAEKIRFIVESRLNNWRQSQRHFIYRHVIELIGISEAKNFVFVLIRSVIVGNVFSEIGNETGIRRPTGRLLSQFQLSVHSENCCQVRGSHWTKQINCAARNLSETSRWSLRPKIEAKGSNNGFRGESNELICLSYWFRSRPNMTTISWKKKIPMWSLLCWCYSSRRCQLISFQSICWTFWHSHWITTYM